MWDTANIMFQASHRTFKFATETSHPIVFHTGGLNNERLRIASGGPHLLLGGTSSVNEITESSANAGMVIGGTGFGNGGLAIINSTSGTGRIYFGDSVGGNAARNRGQIVYYHSSDHMHFATAGSDRLRIGSDGKVGVNTTAGAARLTVDAASGYSIISNGNSNAIALGSNGIILFGNKNAQAYGSGGYDATEHIFKASGSEKVRISSTGQFSVGTTSDVTGVSVAIGGSMRFVNATGQSATITALPSGTYNTGVSGGSAIVFHRISDGGGGSDEIAFETHFQGNSHGERLRINKKGQVLIGDDTAENTMGLEANVQTFGTNASTSGVAIRRGSNCLLYTSPSPRDATLSRMPSSA